MTFPFVTLPDPVPAPVWTPPVRFGNTVWQTFDEAGVEWICENLEGWADLPQGDPTSVNREFDHGSWSGRGWYGPRTLVLTGVLFAPDRATLQTALHFLRAEHAAALANTTVLIVEELDGAKWLRVRTTTAVMGVVYLHPNVVRVTVELSASWPVKQSSVHTETTSGPTESGGRHYNRPSVDGQFRRYGPIGESGNLDLFNAGNAPTRPRFTFTGPSTNPAVIAADQGRRLQFALTLTDDYRLWVDTDSRAVLLNDVASRRYTLTADSAWFALLPGYNRLQYRPGSGSGTLTVEYTDGWW
jgi:hypothetical protein